MRKAIAAIAAGSIAGQIIGLAAAPALSRLYLPNEFGAFAVINGIALTLGAISALKLDAAVPLPKTDDESRQIVRAGLVASFSFTALFCLLAYLTTVIVGRFLPLQTSPAIELLWVAPLIAGTVGTVTVLNQWAIRHSRFGAIGRRNVLNAGVMVAVQLLAGAAGLGTAGLALGLLAGQLAACVALLIGSNLRKGRKSHIRLDEDLWMVIKRYRRFVLELAPASLLNSLGVYSPAILLFVFYGSYESGIFAMAQRVLALPVAILGRSVAQVYLGELAKARRNESTTMLALFTSTTYRLLGVSVVVAVCAAAFSIPVFPFVLGDEWAMSGVVAVALSPFIAGQLVSSPLSQTLVVMERSRTLLILDLARLVAVSGVIAIAALGGAGLITSVFAFSMVSVIHYGVSWLCCRRALAAKPIN